MNNIFKLGRAQASIFLTTLIVLNLGLLVLLGVLTQQKKEAQQLIGAQHYAISQSYAAKLLLSDKLRFQDEKGKAKRADKVVIVELDDGFTQTFTVAQLLLE